MKKTHSKEHIGELFVISQVALYGLFPVIINYVTQKMPPVLYAALVTLTAAVVLFLYLLFTKKLRLIFNRKAFKYILGTTIFVGIIPSILIFTGTRLSSATNTAILLESEVFFTFLICGIFFGEKITRHRLIGALIILIGAIAILYQGSLSINIGDLMIIAATAFFPVGNRLAQKALELCPVSVVLFLRSLIGGLALLFVSFIFEKSLASSIPSFKENLIYILINGIFIFTIAKILWYEGIRRIDISKAISIGIAFPAVSMIFAMIFLKEMPNIYQLTGLIFVLTGVWIVTRKRLPQAEIAPLLD
ncbi:MAG: DMT family transporter [Candidatus Gracilibacteria bacterium]